MKFKQIIISVSNRPHTLLQIGIIMMPSKVFFNIIADDVSFQIDHTHYLRSNESLHRSEMTQTAVQKNPVIKM